MHVYTQFLCEDFSPMNFNQDFVSMPHTASLPSFPGVPGTPCSGKTVVIATPSMQREKNCTDRDYLNLHSQKSLCDGFFFTSWTIIIIKLYNAPKAHKRMNKLWIFFGITFISKFTFVLKMRRFLQYNEILK